MSDELICKVALNLIPGIGNQGVKHLISYCGSAEAVFNAPKSQLLKIPGVGKMLAQAIQSSNTQKEAETVITKTEKMDARVLHYTNPNYPQKLKETPDAPSILFSKGNGDLNFHKTIAIVGTRKATTYGKKITDRIVESLEPFEVSVVSGLAYGIDIHAHKACLARGISTIGVLAGGLDRIYPSAHKKYASDMMEKGGLITESLPGMKSEKHLFPARNRIIAGISDATLVVEAAEKGGALITAHIAYSYNRPIFAVPGNIGNNYSEGTNNLIRSQKALIYTSVEDLVYHLNWETEQEKNEIPTQIPDLPADEERIFKLLKREGRPLAIDYISIQSQIPINQVASNLLSLEFQNLIKSLPGKKYCLN